MNAALARHDFVVPESLVVRELSHRIGHARESLRRQGVDPDAVRWDYEKLSAETPAGCGALGASGALARGHRRPRGGGRRRRGGGRGDRAPGPGVGPRAEDRSGASSSAADELDGLRLSLREAKTLALLIEHAKVEPVAEAGSVAKDE